MAMTYRELYFRLFGEVEDALDALENGETIRAISLLLRAVEAGEAEHLDTDLLPDDRSPPAP